MAIIPTFALSVIYAVIYRPKFDFKNKALWLFTGFFAILLLSALLSHDVAQGIERMEIRLMYLLIPFPVVLIIGFDINRHKILRYFSYAMVVLCAILLGNNVYKIIVNGSFEDCFFHEFTALYKQHAVYFSMLILFAVIILLETVKDKLRTFEILGLFILGIAMFFAASKIMIALMILFLLYYVFFKQHGKWLKMSFLSLVVVVLGLSVASDNLRHRFLDGLDLSRTDFSLEDRTFTYDEKKNISDFELRFLLGKVGVKHMAEDGKIITGYGLGDQQDWFDYHLMRYGLAPDWYMGHNAHNQYLDIWLNTGILGFVFFVFMLVFFVRNAWQTKDEIWLIFLLIFLIAFLLEVYLSRNKGIVFFTLWNMFFYSWNRRQKKLAG